MHVCVCVCMCVCACRVPGAADEFQALEKLYAMTDVYCFLCCRYDELTFPDGALATSIRKRVLASVLVRW